MSEPGGATEDTQAISASASTSGGLPSAARESMPLARGALVGRYVVLSKLGAGGMGVVYGAFDPELNRRVAIKLLHGDARGRIGSPSAHDARARLLREAQALAKLAHPNVVAVHDVGEHEGAVWLAMELVEGQTLGAWLAAQPRSWRDVLAVMTAAGAGLAAAHRAELLHRDFKPDNVMVGADGRVRVMDLGLARSSDKEASTESNAVVSAEAATAVAGDLALLAVRVTQAGVLIGTPAYMSPEQLGGAALDARTDQFSYCVALWEALYGERPFAGETLVELAARVLAGTLRPVPRGARVPGWLRRLCERGLSVAPAERFASMQALLDALGRGSARARARRWLGAAAGIVLVGAAVVGYLRHDLHQRIASCEEDGASVHEVWNDEARSRVHDGLLASGVSYAEVTAEKVMSWLDDSASGWAQARTAACLSTRVREEWSEDLLARAVWCLDERRDELGALVTALSHADATTVNKAVEAAAGLVPAVVCTDASGLAALPEPPRAEQRQAIVEARRELTRASALRSAGHYSEGLEVTRATLSEAEGLQWPPLHADALLLEGTLLTRTGAYAEAEAASVSAYLIAAKARAWDVAVPAATHLVVLVGDLRARSAEGELWAGHADVAIALLGDPLGLREASRLNNLANVHFATGAHAEAKALYERALAIREQALGSDHPDVASSLENLGNLHHAMGEYGEARLLYERGLAVLQQALGPDHPRVAGALHNLGLVHQTMGAHAEAKALHERALVIQEKALGPDHPDVAESLASLGLVHASMGAHAEARALYERALAVQERALGPDHPTVAATLTNLGLVRQAMGAHAEAKADFERALAIGEKALGPDHPFVAAALNNLGTSEQDMGANLQAKAHFERAIAIKEKALGADHPGLAPSLMNLGRVHEALGERAEAKALFQRALAIREAAFGLEHPQVASSLASLGRFALDEERPQEALDLLERAVAIYEAHEGVEENEAEARMLLARALIATGGDRQRALAEVRRGAQAFREVGETGGLAEAEAFLQRHAGE